MSIDYDELCERSYERVARTAYLILGDAHEALDVTQETFAKALARWPEVSKMDSPEAWLIRVATNHSRTLRRRAARLIRASKDRAEPSPEPSDPKLAAALRRLTSAQRTAVVLRYYVDMPVEEVARILGKRPGTIRALTSQGVGRLRDQLGTEIWEERHV